MNFDILLKKYINIIYNRLLCRNHTCHCVGMVSVTSASRYVTSASRYQSRFSIDIRGLIPQNSMELADDQTSALWMLGNCLCCRLLSFFKITFLKKNFQEHNQRVKCFGFKLFAKVISRRQKLQQARTVRQTVHSICFISLQLKSLGHR